MDATLAVTDVVTTPADIVVDSLDQALHKAGAFEYKKRISGSGKERATDIPGWAKADERWRPRVGETPSVTASRIMTSRYGFAGIGWSNASPEYSKIHKWASRAFR